MLDLSCLSVKELEIVRRKLSRKFSFLQRELLAETLGMLLSRFKMWVCCSEKAPVSDAILNKFRSEIARTDGFMIENKAFNLHKLLCKVFPSKFKKTEAIKFTEGPKTVTTKTIETHSVSTPVNTVKIKQTRKRKSSNSSTVLGAIGTKANTIVIPRLIGVEVSVSRPEQNKIIVTITGANAGNIKIEAI